MNHPTAAAKFVANDKRAHWHDKALWFVREKRDRMAHGLPEWEILRETAAAIKAHTVTHLADLLEQFEENATKLGVTVHWARNGAEHNEIVHGLLSDHGVRKVVKSKSMLTEECHLNPYLERHGMEVTDTDLGEWLVQLRREAPSHIVLPAIHISKEEVGELFHDVLGTEAGNSDPPYLAEAARNALRQRFIEADAGLTGVNFAVAETGGIVVCTNEGNADLGTSLPKLHIASMGIEKIIPRSEHLGVFLRLLARSATGQPITTYSSHFHGPRPGQEMHIVLVDNGRSELIGSDEFRRSLNCIRCGACMNTCPVYRRSGGHSYNTTVPGPIGSILAPARDAKAHQSLPFACSLCGSCTDVCPVKIDLHHQLLTWRKEIAVRGLVPLSKRISMGLASQVFKRRWLYELGGNIARWVTPKLPRFLIYNRLNTWGRQREIPEFPKQSFRQAWKKRAGSKPGESSSEASS